MDLFKEQWERQVRVLTDAVDDITSIDDFLAVSGNQGYSLRNNHPPKSLGLEMGGLDTRSGGCEVFGRDGGVTPHLVSPRAQRGVEVQQEIWSQGEDTLCLRIWNCWLS